MGTLMEFKLIYDRHLTITNETPLDTILTITFFYYLWSNRLPVCYRLSVQITYERVLLLFSRNQFKNLPPKICVVFVVYLDQSVPRFVYPNEATFQESQSDSVQRWSTCLGEKWDVYPLN